MTNESDPPKEKRLTEEEFLRLCSEAKARGESITPILRRYALQAIDDVLEHLEKEEGSTEHAAAT